jgi:cytochrome d ubiquinol oxidase subunit II
MFDLEDLAAAAVLLSLIAYALSGGADFGGGVWYLLARGPRAARQREQVAHSIGPIWEANHVWLILAIVVLFTGFPAAFARLTTVLHLPLLVVLLGIVARGAAFSIRSYGQPAEEAAAGEATGKGWGSLFAAASLVTPLFLGIVVGAVAGGRLRAPAAMSDYFTGWLAPLPFAVGVFALALFAYLAAVYLAHDARHAHHPENAAAGAVGRRDVGDVAGTAGDDAAALSDDFRRRALAAGVLLAPLAAAVLWVAGREAPQLLRELTRTRWSWGLHACTAVCALGALAALALRRLRLARAAAAAQVAFILAGWAVAQYPYLVPPDLTVLNAAAPPAVLRLLLLALGLGAVVLAPALWYLYRVFGRVQA